MNRTTARVAAITGATALCLLNASPVLADTPETTPVATSHATALRVSLAGQGADTGQVKATHDGRSQTLTGRTDPPVSVLNNQALANLGVLAQLASTSVDAQGRGSARACAGVAGDGGQIVEVGDTSCLTPGNAVELKVANLDLTGAVLVNPASALAPLQALQPIIDQLLGPLTSAISQGLAPLDSGLITVNLGAITSSCNAPAGGAVTGSSSLVDASIDLEFAGRTITLVELPVAPGPNTDLLVNLDDVVSAVLAAVRTELNTALDGNLAALSAIIDPIQEQLVDRLLAQIAPQLAPLSDNVLTVTLNKQTPGPGTLDVTALQVELLPAAKQFIGGALIDASIAEVSCGPTSTRTAPTPSPTTGPTTDPTTDPTGPTDPTDPATDGPEVQPGTETNPNPGDGTVPVTVAAGLSGESEAGIGLRNGLVAGSLGLLAAIGLGSVVAANRRSRRSGLTSSTPES